jgi:hypothetical protein
MPDETSPPGAYLGINQEVRFPKMNAKTLAWSGGFGEHLRIDPYAEDAVSGDGAAMRYPVTRTFRYTAEKGVAGTVVEKDASFLENLPKGSTIVVKRIGPAPRKTRYEREDVV